MFYVHVGSENIPHHCCDTRKGSLIPCCADPRDCEEERAHSSSKGPEVRQGVRCVVPGPCVALQEHRPFSGAVRCPVVRGERQAADFAVVAVAAAGDGDGVTVAAVGQVGVAASGLWRRI